MPSTLFVILQPYHHLSDQTSVLTHIWPRTQMVTYPSTNQAQCCFSDQTGTDQATAHRQRDLKMQHLEIHKDLLRANKPTLRDLEYYINCDKNSGI